MPGTSQLSGPRAEQAPEPDALEHNTMPSRSIAHSMLHELHAFLFEKGASFLTNSIHKFKEAFDEFRAEFTTGLLEMSADVQDFTDLMLRTMEDPEKTKHPFLTDSARTVIESVPKVGPFRQYVDARQQLEIASQSDDREVLEYAREEYLAACMGLLGEVPTPLSPILFVIGVKHNINTMLDPDHEYKDLVAEVADLAVRNKHVRHLVDHFLSWHESPEVQAWLYEVEREEDAA